MPTIYIRSGSDVKMAGFIQITLLIEKLIYVTATSAPVKCVFSHGRLFVRSHRARLSVKMHST